MATAWNGFPEFLATNLQIYLMTKQFSNLSYEKTEVWPMVNLNFEPGTNLHVDLWQKCGLTYNKTTVRVMIILHIELW